MYIKSLKGTDIEATEVFDKEGCDLHIRLHAKKKNEVITNLNKTADIYEWLVEKFDPSARPYCVSSFKVIENKKEKYFDYYIYYKPSMGFNGNKMYIR